jgi:formylglycine-generating enzyme required for sulfatase activity
MFFALALAHSFEARAITMAWSPVGNPGNAADPATGSLYGAVPYNFSIGTYDVTAGQYVDFLNAKDPGGANALGLYNVNMSNATYGGISFNNGNSPGSMYSVIPGRELHPANFTSWIDAVRFADWLNNGAQANSDTESGAYYLEGGTPLPSNAGSIARQPNARIFIPNDSEWYKAAYYDPSTGLYNEYSTSSSTPPTASGPTATPNSVNYNNAVGNLTDVGAYTTTTSPFGPFDMAGNVWQWMESYDVGTGLRNLRGGSFSSIVSDDFASFARLEDLPMNAGIAIAGFRVATVPEP